MAKLRRLTGTEVIRILQQLGFEVRRISGSHHHMQLQTSEVSCRVTVPVHGNKTIAIGTLRSIYLQALVCIPEEELKTYFYAP